MHTDEPDVFAERVLLMSIILVCVSCARLQYAARFRLIDEHNVCGGEIVSLLSKICHFASSVFSAMSWSRSTSFWTRDCRLYLEGRIALRIYLI